MNRSSILALALALLALAAGPAAADGDHHKLPDEGRSLKSSDDEVRLKAIEQVCREHEALFRAMISYLSEERSDLYLDSVGRVLSRIPHTYADKYVPRMLVSSEDHLRLAGILAAGHLDVFGRRYLDRLAEIAASDRVEKVRRAAEETVARLTRIGTWAACRLAIGGMMDPRLCPDAATEALVAAGARQVVIDFPSGRASFWYDPTATRLDDLRRALLGVSYTMEMVEPVVVVAERPGLTVRVTTDVATIRVDRTGRLTVGLTGTAGRLEVGVRADDNVEGLSGDGRSIETLPVEVAESFTVRRLSRDRFLTLLVAIEGEGVDRFDVPLELQLLRD